MYPLYLREKARRLRREKKLTIDELAECLALSRSTIYYWVRDIPVPRKTRAQWPESARLAAGRAVRKKFRLLREAAYAEGRASFADLCADSTFRDFVNLYIAEGYKRCRNSVSLSNSDPAVIRLATHWIRRLTKNPIDSREGTGARVTEFSALDRATRICGQGWRHGWIACENSG